ncbi:MAG: hypothetical protein ACJ8C4_16760 [Gemmataceae bacterium]
MNSEHISHLLKLDDDPSKNGRDPSFLEGVAVAREALAPLQMLDDETGPPAGLADRTLAYVRRRSIVESVQVAGPAISKGPGRSRADVVVAASLLIAFGALGMGALNRVNQSYSVQACQNNLYRFFTGLETYAASHNGQFPDLGPSSAPAGSFVEMLTRDGVWDSQTSVACPAVHVVAAASPTDLDYAYALGSRGPDGEIHGPSHKVGDIDTMPLLADRPLAGWVPRPTVGNHRNGANVLFMNGAVQFCTLPTVGWEGDHIYLNDARRVAAGLHPHDAVLGEKFDRP